MRFDDLSAWLRWQEGLHPRAIDLGLDRVRAVAERLGVLAAPAPVMTVAGTNGKGTTIACLEAALLAAGYRPGAYTSPHLLRYNERIRIGGTEIADGTLVRLFDAVDRARDDVTLTYFEFGTLAALLAFREAGCDVWLLEVGLGGRLDAVNVVDADVAVVTNVSVDHTDWLGTDREQIAVEKAGVLRAARPVVTGEVEPPAALRQAAERLEAPLLVPGEGFEFEGDDDAWDWWTPNRRLSRLPRPPLLAGASLANAAVALVALDRMGDRLPVSEAAIRAGLAELSLPGRNQRLSGEPVWWLDVAHNAEAAAALAARLRDEPVTGRTHAVFGLMRRKDLAAVIAPMAAPVDRWYPLALPEPEAWPTTALGEAIRAHGGEVTASGPAESLLPRVKSDARPGDRVVAFGSFRVVETVLRELRAC